MLTIRHGRPVLRDVRLDDARSVIGAIFGRARAYRTLPRSSALRPERNDRRICMAPREDLNRKDLNRNAEGTPMIQSVGMLAAAAAVLGLLFGAAFYFNGDKTTTTATNANRPAVTAPTTTGSSGGSTVPSR
jgi:hypothetical protein